jgi:P27 family predicted phage terminase small subunit
MGRSGPAPKPTALRVLQGNPGKIPLNPREPSPPAAATTLPPPSWLSEEAKEAWARLRPSLPWLTTADMDTFAAYCATYARWREVAAILEAGGLTFEIRAEGKPNKRGEVKLGPVKYVQQRPEVAIERQSLAMLCKLAGELGLTPAARTRIQVEPPEAAAKDKTAERMFGS